ncbi:MAG: hypothetical protein K6E99_04625 [Bacilli bacterium]|nr:hypothetical protein [Bacilli bacterium]
MKEDVKYTSNLGLSSDLDDINIDDICNNKVALNMLLHNYRKIEEENIMLKQDVNRQSTIERMLYIKEKYTKIASHLGLLATVLIGFGINFVTNNIKDIKGLILLGTGIILQIISIKYSNKKGDEND